MCEPHVSDQNLLKLGMSGLKKTAFFVLFNDEKGQVEKSFFVKKWAT